MPDSKAKRDWIKANTTMVAVKLNHNTDKDLLAALEGCESKAGRIKQLARLGLETEKRKKSD